MLTNETQEKLVAKIKELGITNMHLTTTRNLDAFINDPNAILEDRVPDGFVPWQQDEPAVLEWLKALDAIENGDYEEVEFIDSHIRQMDIRDYVVLIEHGIDGDKAAEIAQDMLEKRREKN